MHLSRYRWSTVGLLTICCVLTLPEQSHAQKVSFLESVAPLLQNRCLQCHNDSVTEGGLSLATSQDLVDGGYVQPGSPDESDLISLVTPHGARAEMPKDERPLTGEQIKTLAQWIEEGATWPSDVVLTDPVVSDLDWWSLKPLTRPALPAGNQTTHPVDNFVQAGYTKQGLSPVQTASPENLVRRIYYDLTGLPPTGDEVAAFLQESKTDPEAAWLTLVDRLLASDNFGEKFAHHWLDLARYAETHGYDKDKLRTNAWPYRDYVIASFNADKPYSRFVQEQVAGDVLFPGTPDGIVGLGFLAAGPWDFIGHVEVGEGKQDGRIAKHLDRDEMLAACFNVFMSTTIQCAQCHNHKFDPLSMQDYYEGHAIFAAVDRADRLYTGLSPDQLQERDSLVAELAALKSESNRLAAEAKSRLAPLVADLDPKIKALRDQFGQQPPAQHGYHSQVSKSNAEAKWIQIDFGDVVSIDKIRLRAAFDNYNQIGGGFGFPIRYRVEGSQDPLFQDATVRLLHDASTSDQPNPGLKPVEIAGEGVPVRYLRVTATKLAERKNDFIFALAELEFDIDRDVKTSGGTDDQKLPTAPSITALDSIESGERWRQINLVDGIYYQELRDASAQQELWRLLEQRDQFVQQVRDPQAELRQTEIQKQAKTLEAKIGQFPEGEFVYAASTQFSPAGQFRSTGGAPRAIHLLHRGDIGSPGDLMHPDGPILWGEASWPFQGIAVTDEQAARGAFAEYLTSPENPLTWRAIANRLVQWTFGKPLVGTPNDFGRMGMLPSHPELLDFLAATLRDDPNHSLKSIIRLLVTSQTYRLAATTDEANADLDADNRYLWQAHRRRLSAEELRDSMLALAGVLQIDQRGGASFQDFVIEKPQHSPHYEYHLHDPLDPRSHRRSIYRFVVRSQPQPMLTTLDCADPSISVPMRDESTTALQALTQWNSQLSIAMADQFAVRLKALDFPTEQAAVQWACQQAWGRAPTEEDLAVLVPLLKVHGGSALGRVLMNSSPFTYIE
ncbi:Planctomycete cytochrome C [Roseimaritima multifibrata]|uniref:Planctomycete cytochrome C n=1 Tax=Roseimaritima multifibrata TaxID=1930274 RepID=A0A517MEK2_9BACT|nr:DUF1549 domain-containing protein [Roseimaritima multifibrata]QDS93311.1 Planctomycete cytochrome C [Roseimaritima multifibrata]